MVDHTRDLLKERERLDQYYGALENALYAAEVSCTAKVDGLNDVPECVGCRFCGSSIFLNPGACKRKALRLILGEHVEQHDCMRRGE